MEFETHDMVISSSMEEEEEPIIQVHEEAVALVGVIGRDVVSTLI
jgi:hypothetical protein